MLLTAKIAEEVLFERKSSLTVDKARLLCYNFTCYGRRGRGSRLKNMKDFIQISDFEDKRLDVYTRLTGAQLRNKLEPERGVLIAESPTVIEVAMKSGVEPISLLTERRLINGAVRGIIDSLPEQTPVFCAEREIFAKMTGFELMRGALAAMKRPAEKSAEELCRGARRVAVFEGVADATNIGALFRCAAAFDVDAVLVTPTCCDPFCRRAVRVSMGTVFQIPWAKIGESAEEWEREGVELLHNLGFKTCAMALRDDSYSIDDDALRREDRLAIILGTEGTGLLNSTIEKSDYTVKIPMSHGVDSLNVAAAGAVAFYALTRR